MEPELGPDVGWAGEEAQGRLAHRHHHTPTPESYAQPINAPTAPSSAAATKMARAQASLLGFSGPRRKSHSSHAPVSERGCRVSSGVAQAPGKRQK